MRLESLFVAEQHERRSPDSRLQTPLAHHCPIFLTATFYLYYNGTAAVMRHTWSSIACLFSLLMSQSTIGFLLPYPSGSFPMARPHSTLSSQVALFATTVPRAVGLEAIPEADLKAADKTAPPSTFFECTLQAYNAAAAAIKDGYKLLEVEFPPLPAAEMASQVTYIIRIFLLPSWDLKVVTSSSVGDPCRSCISCNVIAFSSTPLLAAHRPPAPTALAPPTSTWRTRWPSTSCVKASKL